jgi:hypothetical protein
VPARRAIRGRTLKVDAPEWEPLLNLAPDHVVDFMWMGAVLLADGTRIHVYKHYWTRDYLHLADDGRAFVFVPKVRRGRSPSLGRRPSTGSRGSVRFTSSRTAGSRSSGTATESQRTLLSTSELYSWVMIWRETLWRSSRLNEKGRSSW